MEGADGLGVLVSGIGEGHDVVAQHGQINDLVHHALGRAELRLGLLGVLLDGLVHTVDGGLQVLAGLVVLHQRSRRT